MVQGWTILSRAGQMESWTKNDQSWTFDGKLDNNRPDLAPIYNLLIRFESRAKPAFAWGKMKSLKTGFSEELKPADCFFKGGKRPQKFRLVCPPE